MDTEIKYKVCKNNSETAEKAPHLIKFISNGTVSAEELAKIVHKNNPAVQEADVMLLMRTMNELVYELMVEGDATKVDVGFGVFEKVITGTLKNADDQPDETNKVRLCFRPSKEFQEAIDKADFEFVRVGGPASGLSIRSTTTPSLGRGGENVLRAGERFTMVLKGVEGEQSQNISVELTDSAETAHLVEVLSVKGDTVECVAPANLAAGKARLLVIQPLGDDDTLSAIRNLTVAP